MSSLVSWLLDAVRGLLWRKNVKIAFIGLDNAGKSTLLWKLAHGKLTQCEGTRYAQSMLVRIGSANVKVFDLPGHKRARPVWRDYVGSCDALVFLVDAAAPRRLPEARAEIQYLLTQRSLDHVPVLVLGNKVDRAGALSDAQLASELGVEYTRTGKERGGRGGAEGAPRPFELFMCSVKLSAGYNEGFEWLATKFP